MLKAPSSKKNLFLAIAVIDEENIKQLNFHIPLLSAPFYNLDLAKRNVSTYLVKDKEKHRLPSFVLAEPRLYSYDVLFNFSELHLTTLFI